MPDARFFKDSHICSGERDVWADGKWNEGIEIKDTKSNIDIKCGKKDEHNILQRQQCMLL